jgi:hypothetical protein
MREKDLLWRCHVSMSPGNAKGFSTIPRISYQPGQSTLEGIHQIVITWTHEINHTCHLATIFSLFFSSSQTKKANVSMRNQEGLRATLRNWPMKVSRVETAHHAWAQMTLTSHNVAFNGDHHMCCTLHTKNESDCQFCPSIHRYITTNFSLFL